MFRNKRQLLFLTGIAITAFTALTGCGTLYESGVKAMPDTRSFYMGFQDFSYDKTPEAQAETNKWVQDHADIVCLQFGSDCPWAEAAEGKPWPTEMLNMMRDRKAGVGPNAKIYLELSPLDMGRAAIGGNVPDSLKGKGFDEPIIQKAYLAYARGMVEYFQPAYLCIGIEVNELMTNTPAAWPGYVELHKNTYAALKKEYPNLPIFTTHTLHALLAAREKNNEQVLNQFKEFMQYNDIAGISFYPFLFREQLLANPAEDFDWVKSLVGDKPMTITETTYPAEPIVLKDKTIPGTPEMQEQYLKALLEIAQREHYFFVIWFSYRGYDAWWAKIQNQYPEWVKVWKDSGLVDEANNPRIALDTWMDWFGKTYAQN